MNIQMIKKTLAAAVVALLAVPLLVGPDREAHAQALRVGYTDHEIIIVNMPEYQSIQQALRQEYERSQEELATEYQNFQQDVERYQTQQSLLSEDRRAEREQQLIERHQRIQQEAQQMDEALAQREFELMRPLLERVQTAIDAVAERRNLDLVLRTQVGQQPVLLYVNERTVENITLEVAAELGLDVDQEDATGSASTN
jgi:outer membrane protein